MPNQLRIDPTRTTSLVRRWQRDSNRRFRWLNKEIRKLIVDLDVFGLIEQQPLKILVDKQAWRFLTDAQKMKQFRSWLTRQVNAGILETTTTPPWMATYVDSAYRKGMVGAYSDVIKTRGGTIPNSYFRGGRDEFLRAAFAQPETLAKIELIYTRAYTDLVGVTDYMGQQLSRTLANGLAAGQGPSTIAREMSNKIGGITRTRANMIARTEVISAHAEAQLDTMGQLGVKEVSNMAEWSTAADACHLCAPMDGAILTVGEARGAIPRHPNCRCMWIPAGVGESKKGQLWHDEKDKAVAKSLAAEGGKDPKKKSSWIAKRLVTKKEIKAAAKTLPKKK